MKAIWEQRSDGAVLKEVCFSPLFQLKSCCDPAVSSVEMCCILFRRAKLRQCSHSLKHHLRDFAQAQLNGVLLGLQKASVRNSIFQIAQFPLEERSRKL